MVDQTYSSLFSCGPKLVNPHIPICANPRSLAPTVLGSGRTWPRVLGVLDVEVGGEKAKTIENQLKKTGASLQAGALTKGGCATLRVPLFS